MPGKRITLALQGGGLHGAFTWGAPERLPEDERIVIEGISGASAGAINAGGRLDVFNGSRCAQTQSGNGCTAVPVEFPVAEPVQPARSQPAADILTDQVDFSVLRESCVIKLFLSATQAAAGKARVFSSRELPLDVLPASACLPSISRSPSTSSRTGMAG